ncbi:hypothetical protein VP01_9290g1 [Puccinia sorghi]|uniref:Uncharacterized protein n=1 Tax=Puccinia sorghi TaxID=27349 RepID=A0A0L6U739_9BASI|nr:hypothetical protein VP01_9290g1 [Puccinia sorghi]
MNDSGERKSASFTSCKLDMSTKLLCGTKHLWPHLEWCNNFNTMTKQTLLKTLGSSSISNRFFSQDKAHQVLIKLIIADKLCGKKNCLNW